VHLPATASGAVQILGSSLSLPAGQFPLEGSSSKRLATLNRNFTVQLLAKGFEEVKTRD
jgi:hypothetical protein